MSHYIQQWQFTNHGSNTCTLSGYPKVELVNDHGGAIPTTDYHGGGFAISPAPPTVVALRPGDPAFFAIETVTCSVIGKSDVRAAGISVIPPGVGSAALTTMLPISMCSDHGVVVSPVRSTPEAINEMPVSEPGPTVQIPGGFGTRLYPGGLS
jgi:hypothetical protein